MATLTVTRRQFDFSDSKKWYFGDNQFVTNFMNALSAAFPAGEQFFVDAVRSYRTVLPHNHPFQKEISGFIGQEAMHSMVHESFNQYAARHDIPMDQVERGVWIFLDQVTKVLPKRLRLAATVCLEHYTAIMASQLLNNERFNSLLTGELREMWLWHAGEEIAHSHVAWDLYHNSNVGGNLRERALMMIATTIVFAVIVFTLTTWFCLRQGLRPKDFVSGLTILFGKQGFLSSSTLDILDFFKSNFHPNQHKGEPSRAVEHINRFKEKKAV